MQTPIWYWLLGISIMLSIIYLFPAAYYSGPVSDHFDGKHFFNPHAPVDKRGKFATLRWRMGEKHPKWPESIPLTHVDKPPVKVDGNELRISAVGHATVLIQTEGLNILTDPIWSKRASPFSFIGPKRVTPPGIAWEDLPKIDVVLVSHNHYDHLDLPTLKRLWKRDKPLIVTPLGNESIIHSSHPAIKVKTLDWSQCLTVNSEPVKICLEPVQHWSARWPNDRNKALWGSYVIQTAGGNIYFAGDAGYSDSFKIVRQKYGDFRFAMLPIGAYLPRWFMGYSHMNPPEAVKAFEDLGTPYTLAIHHDVFHLADDKYGEAVKDLETALANHHHAARFKVLEPGESWQVPAQ